MAINKIKIKNFTVFEDFEMEFSPGVNVIIGENGTGKTHLLKLLYGVEGIYNGEDNYSEIFVGHKTDRSEDYEVVTSDGETPGFIHEKVNCHLKIDGYIGKKPPAHFSKIDEQQEVAIDKSTEISVNISEKYSDKDDNPLKYVFIPAKEMLSISRIARLAKSDLKKLGIEKTLTDIIIKARSLGLGEVDANFIDKIANVLEKHMDGTVVVDDDYNFWMKKHGRDELIPFSMEAEGLRKLGLLWLLVMNKSIDKGSVLLWDEPEANINPELIPDLVEILLELSRNGVQVIVTTHDYMFVKFIEASAKKADNVQFCSISKTDRGGKYECKPTFTDLRDNAITRSMDLLVDYVIIKGVEI